MIFPFLLYKLFSNLRSELFFFYFIVFHLYLRILIKFFLLYFANFLFLICDSRLWLLFCVSLLSVNVKFANLKFAILLRVDSVNDACEGISIILNLFIYVLAILSVLNVDAAF